MGCCSNETCSSSTPAAPAGRRRWTANRCSPSNPISPNSTFERAVADCGAQLNHTFRSARGGYVHASDLFTTANSARDLAAVLRALHQGKVDLYGDSYGTYFAQSFLSRYPRMLRSVVLDSAYEARDLDPWYVTTVRTARRAFAAVCVQAASCRAATGSRANAVWTRIATLTRLLRQHPIVGTAPGVDARPVRERIDVTALVNIVNDAGYDPDPYRQLDAAVRAYLDHRDAVPLVRLYAQDIGYDYSDYQARASVLLRRPVHGGCLHRLPAAVRHAVGSRGPVGRVGASGKSFTG